MDYKIIHQKCHASLQTNNMTYGHISFFDGCKQSQNKGTVGPLYKVQEDHSCKPA